MLLLDLIAGMELAPQKPKEIVVLRYYDEVVLDKDEALSERQRERSSAGTAAGLSSGARREKSSFSRTASLLKVAGAFSER